MKRTQYHSIVILMGALLGLLAGCVYSSGPEIQCTTNLEFGGTTYISQRVDKDAVVRVGRALGDAVVPACAAEGDGPDTVAVSAIKGVPPDVAFVPSDDRREVYWPRSRANNPPEAVRRLIDGT